MPAGYARYVKMPYIPDILLYECRDISRLNLHVINVKKHPYIPVINLFEHYQGQIWVIEEIIRMRAPMMPPSGWLNTKSVVVRLYLSYSSDKPFYFLFCLSVKISSAFSL